MNTSPAHTESLEARRLFAVAVGLTDNNALVEFDTARPAVLTSGVRITGLQTGERIVSIDFRPSTGFLYGLGDSSRLYVIDRKSGAATALSANAFATPLSGTKVSMDFNPFADAVRVVSSAEQNLRVNVNTGAVVDGDTVTAGVQGDGNLAYAAGDLNVGNDPTISAAAYSANFSGTSATTLYAIDSQANTLVTSGSTSGAPVSPNTGSLRTVGTLGFDVNGETAMDIYTTSRGNEAILVGNDAAITSTGRQADRLYRVDLSTGATTFVGLSGSNRDLIGLALAPAQTQALVLGTSNRIVKVTVADSTQPATSIRVRLPQGVTLLGIDVRPSNNVLYGLGDDAQIYVINSNNGRVTALPQAIGVALEGTNFAMDFNPVADAIRIVSNTGQNLRVNATTGALAMADADIAFASGDTNAAATPTVGAGAYTNMAAGPASTTLYDLDAATDTLVTQGSINSAPVSPNSGQLQTVGSLGLDISDTSGLDITTVSGVNRAVAVFNIGSNGRAGLYDVNLFNGRTARMISLPRGVYSDVAILPIV